VAFHIVFQRRGGHGGPPLQLDQEVSSGSRLTASEYNTIDAPLWHFDLI
jgi:hypothetical protein